MLFIKTLFIDAIDLIYMLIHQTQRKAGQPTWVQTTGGIDMLRSLSSQLHHAGVCDSTPPSEDWFEGRQAAKLEGQQAKDKAAAAAVIQGTDERDLWRGGLDALLEALPVEDAKMDKRASLLAEQKTAAGGRKVCTLDSIINCRPMLYEASTMQLIQDWYV